MSLWVQKMCLREKQKMNWFEENQNYFLEIQKLEKKNFILIKKIDEVINFNYF